eukprot:4049635-Lingulodinium_polyedra.AAC.1
MSKSCPLASKDVENAPSRGALASKDVPSLQKMWRTPPPEGAPGFPGIPRDSPRDSNMLKTDQKYENMSTI